MRLKVVRVVLVLSMFVAGTGVALVAGSGAGAQDPYQYTTTKTKTTLCHKAGKSGKYKKINVSSNAVDAHLAHGDFAIPPAGTCPAA